MFAYLDELYEIAGCKNTDTLDKYKLFMLSNNVLYVADFAKILSLSESLIVLKIKGDQLNIEGSSLVVKNLDTSEIIITGKILSIYLSNGVTKWAKKQLK